MIAYFTYVLIIDLSITLLVGLIYGSHGTVILTTIIVKMLVLFISFLAVYKLVSNVKNENIRGLIVLLASYIGILGSYFLIREHNKPVLESLISIHTDSYVFTLVILPLILANVLTFLFFKFHIAG
jgi:hypothetical protein